MQCNQATDVVSPTGLHEGTTAYCSESRTRRLTTIIDCAGSAEFQMRALTIAFDHAFGPFSWHWRNIMELERRDTGRPRLSSEETSASMVDLVIVANIATTLHCEEFLVSHLLSKYCHLLQGSLQAGS
jgi:hypothetical protein